MNLYEIDARIMEAFEAAVDDETGEIVNEEAYAALDALQEARDEKIENVLLWIKDLKSDAEQLKNEKRVLETRQREAERKAESLQEYVKRALDGQKFKTSRVAVSYRASKAIEYAGDINALPEAFIRRKDPELNKTALKEALDNGAEIPGVSIVTRSNMVIR